MKSLYSGVSGLRNHQTKMDVIGNNIANVNTSGYKSQRTTFRDLFYQTTSSPSTGSGNIGGTNASQVGYGAKVGSIDTINTISGYSPTDKATDLYINGEGYFAVQNSSGDIRYTRLGALNFDSEGNLVDVNGSKVYGENGATALTSSTTVPNDTIKIDLKKYNNITINPDGTISAYNTTAKQIETVGQITVAVIDNNDALVAEGNSYYSAGNNAGDITYAVAGVNSGSLVTGGLEMSNVDLAKEFSDMIITQRGFQANSKIISVADEMLQELVNLKR
jgi:flagellar hook protein FlgE